MTGAVISLSSDVLVTSSHDATVCLWSLENFSLLNTIELTSPILNIQISTDSVSHSFQIIYGGVRPCQCKIAASALHIYLWWPPSHIVSWFSAIFAVAIELVMDSMFTHFHLACDIAMWYANDVHKLHLITKYNLNSQLDDDYIVPHEIALQFFLVLVVTEQHIALPMSASERIIWLNSWTMCHSVRSTCALVTCPFFSFHYSFNRYFCWLTARIMDYICELWPPAPNCTLSKDINLRWGKCTFIHFLTLHWGSRMIRLEGLLYMLKLFMRTYDARCPISRRVKRYMKRT